MRSSLLISMALVASVLGGCGGRHERPDERPAVVRLSALLSPPGRAGLLAATDAAGVVTAITFGARDGAMVRRRRLDGAWTPPRGVPGYGSGSRSPDVSASGSGPTALVFDQAGPPGVAGRIRVVRGRCEQSLPGRMHGTLHPAVAVDRRGDAVVAWSAAHVNAESTFPFGPLAVAWCPGGRRCGPVHLRGPLTIGAPSVALGPNGSGVVAWVEGRRRVAGGVVEAALLRRGHLGRPTAVGSTLGIGTDTAAADDGSAVIAWTDANRAVQAVVVTAAGALRPTVTVGDPSDDGFSVVGGARGTLAVATTQDAGQGDATAQAVVAVAGRGQPLGPAVALPVTGAFATGSGPMAIDAHGRVAALVLGADAGTGTVVRVDSGARYRSRVVVSPPGLDVHGAHGAVLLPLPDDDVLALVQPGEATGRPVPLLAGLVPPAG